MQSPEFKSPPRGATPETVALPATSSADVRAGVLTIILIVTLLPLWAAAWLFSWGLTGAAWNYAARMWGAM